MLEEEGGNLSLESGIQRTGLPGETGVGREQGWQPQEWSLHVHRVGCCGQQAEGPKDIHIRTL